MSSNLIASSAKTNRETQYQLSHFPQHFRGQRIPSSITGADIDIKMHCYDKN